MIEPSTLHYNLLPLRETYINKHACCEICVTDTKIASIIPVAHILHDTGRRLLDVGINIHTTTPGINANPRMTDREFINDFRQPCADIHGPTSDTFQPYIINGMCPYMTTLTQ